MFVNQSIREIPPQSIRWFKATEGEYSYTENILLSKLFISNSLIPFSIFYYLLHYLNINYQLSLSANLSQFSSISQLFLIFLPEHYFFLICHSEMLNYFSPFCLCFQLPFKFHRAGFLRAGFCLQTSATNNRYRVETKEILESDCIKFIMRARKEKSELHISFSQQNNKRQADDNMLHQQMLRVHATQKLTMMNELWKMHQSQLCKFFTTYPLFPRAIFTIKDLLNSRFLKLIKSDGKIYFGEIQMKKRNGYGICVYKEGKLFEGTFCNNDRHGKGVEIYANGNLYIGEFLNNKKHGRGQFYWFNVKEDGRKNHHEMEYFDGDWWGGLPDGEGLHQKNNGDIYEGTFKNGLKHGMGEEMFGNGDYYKGEYVNGLPEGFGEYVWADKSRYKGDFKQGLRNGYGYWESQKKQETYQGHYCMDKKSGYGVYEWGNGLCYKGSFEQDYRNGYGQLFDGDEMIYQGYWEQGEKTTGQDIQPSKQQKKIKTPKSLEHNNRTSLISSRKPTLNIEDRITKYKPSRTILPGKNDFSIRKRPQSFSNIRKQEAVIYHSTPKKSMEIKTNKETTTISGSRTSTKMPFSTLYVPWDS